MPSNQNNSNEIFGSAIIKRLQSQESSWNDIKNQLKPFVKNKIINIKLNYFNKSNKDAHEQMLKRLKTLSISIPKRNILLRKKVKIDGLI